ncbi:MAG: prepilin-type N-terminal cleavage/methylation domain-containing protein [Comamonadaceae bacterium]|nr:prepilin-type N-terminal cleavage/methylation domain-containing protein [Comamonadaceae bacterium]RRD57211.1 prepilin-type N-terminal cleavage/methylation domain-containing protein [Comamonadaceae bacterium OH2545_COT-014]
MKRGHVRPPRGFSLLEILVAFAIMALALGMLYRVMGSNARHTAGLAERERAVLLAESLLAAHELVPAEGIRDDGESAGYVWQVRSVPRDTPASADPRAAKLHEVQVQVQWQDGERTRQFALTTLRPERLPQPGGVIR